MFSSSLASVVKCFASLVVLLYIILPPSICILSFASSLELMVFLLLFDII